MQESRKGTSLTIMIEYDTQKSMCANCTHDFQCKRSAYMIVLVDKENYLSAPQCDHHVAKPIRPEGQQSLMEQEDRPFRPIYEKYEDTQVTLETDEEEDVDIGEGAIPPEEIVEHDEDNDNNEN